MNLDLLKEKYRQFKRWQRGPVKYVDCNETHYCNNCGLMFVGNYCPRCSQRADMGRISWKSVRNGVMDIWGLGTRSLIYSIWQLLLRPGYFISDYISGKRQVSFPPVKMLFIVTVIFSLVVYSSSIRHSIRRKKWSKRRHVQGVLSMVSRPLQLGDVGLVCFSHHPHMGFVSILTAKYAP